jgi:hypothetical protein
MAPGFQGVLRSFLQQYNRQKQQQAKTMSGYDLPYELEHVTSYDATLEPPEIIGELAEGLRANYYVTGGTVDGPKLKGKLRPVGADWLTLRRDGIIVLDVRATMIDLGEDGYAGFVAGNPPPPEGLDIRITPKFHCAHPDYLWINRAVCVGIGKAYLDKNRVCYDIYQVK